MTGSQPDYRALLQRSLDAIDELELVATIGLAGVQLATASIVSLRRLGGAYLLGPRDLPREVVGLADLVVRAHRNLLEIFPQFAAALFVVHTAGAAGAAIPSYMQTNRPVVSMYQVLKYIKSTFDKPDVLDSVPLEAAGNPGAWHAWRTHRRKQKAKEVEGAQQGAASARSLSVCSAVKRG